MRRITVAVMSTISALVLLFGYHTSTNSAVAGEPAPAGDDDAAAASGGNAADPGDSSSGGSSSGTTYTGDAEDTQWGVVQVRITVQDGKVTGSEAVRFPQNNVRDQQINEYAVPQLNSEVVQDQSASIDAVSGATVTSDGYIRSLQSAFDQADL